MATARLDKVKCMIPTAAFEVDIASAGAHICDRCNISITSEDRMVLESIDDQVHSVSTETKMGLVYIGGYLARRHPALAGRPTDTDACGFIDAVNNGKLTYPCDELLALLVFLYVFYENSQTPFCRSSLRQTFNDIRIFYGFPETLVPVILPFANVLLNNVMKSSKNTQKENGKKMMKFR